MSAAPHSAPRLCMNSSRSWRAGCPMSRLVPLAKPANLRHSTSRTVQCMAHPRRVARVAKQIEREIGQLILTDETMQVAVCPEKKGGGSNALSAIATVTEVELTNDLQVAKVYVSIFSDDYGRQQAMAGLKNLEGYVRKHVADNVRLRLCPEIRFIHDDSIERGEQVLALLERIKLQAAGEVEPPPIMLPSARELEEAFEEDDEEGEGEWREKERRKSSLSRGVQSRQRMARSRQEPLRSQGPAGPAETPTEGDGSGLWAAASRGAGALGGDPVDISDDEDGFLDLSDEEDESEESSTTRGEAGRDGAASQTSVEQPGQRSGSRVQRSVAQPGDGFFGFEEPAAFMPEEPGLPFPSPLRLDIPDAAPPRGRRRSRRS